MQYKALQNIQRNGELIKPGELVDMTETEAEQLIKFGAIEPFFKRFSREVVVPGAPSAPSDPL